MFGTKQCRVQRQFKNKIYYTVLSIKILSIPYQVWTYPTTIVFRSISGCIYIIPLWILILALLVKKLLLAAYPFAGSYPLSGRDVCNCRQWNVKLNQFEDSRSEYNFHFLSLMHHLWITPVYKVFIAPVYKGKFNTGGSRKDAVLICTPVTG